MPPGDLFPEILYHNFITTSTVVLRRAVLAELGRFDPTLPRAQDWDLWIRIAEHSRLVYVDQALSYLRLHGQNLDIQASDTTFEVQERVLEKAFARHPELDERVRRTALAYYRFRCGMRCYAGFDLPKARRLFLQALRR